MATGTYGEPGKNTYTIQGVSGILSNVVNAETGVTQVYKQGAALQFQSLGTYNPSTGKFTPSTNASTNEAKALSSSSGITNIKNASITTAKKSGLEANQAQKLISPNAALVQPNQDDTGGTGSLTGFGIEGETDQFKTKQAYGTWVYPTALKTNKQDYITFTMYEYAGGRNININQTTAKGQGLIGSPNIIKTTLGSVVLPIQPSITDQNVVDWQGEGINPLQAIGASVSSELIETGQVSEATLKQLGAMGVSPNTMAYLRQWAAGKAVGVNLFARLSAAVVNPNLELLFSGPQLRPFNFSFRLSPRDLGEANNVKGIIRFFKQGMSVRRASDKLFLKAPNVFEIQYINGQTGKPHNSINKIKVCALTNCGVDYTPDGSYATFADPQSTMTSYGLNLQFSELEPIFNEDYGNPGETSIGY